MNRVAKQAQRPYRSELRTQQAQDTRARILDATVQVLARGLADVSIPAVAEEAGVSVPTVYRHFGSKRELFAAVFPHAVQAAGLHELPIPRTLDELRDGVVGIFERLDALDDVARAAVASPAAEQVRHASIPTRISMAEQLTSSIRPKLRKADRERINRLIVALTTSATLTMLRDHLGLTIDQAADDIDWIVRAAVAAATSREAT